MLSHRCSCDKWTSNGPKCQLLNYLPSFWTRDVFCLYPKLPPYLCAVMMPSSFRLDAVSSFNLSSLAELGDSTGWCLFGLVADVPTNCAASSATAAEQQGMQPGMAASHGALVHTPASTPWTLHMSSSSTKKRYSYITVA